MRRTLLVLAIVLVAAVGSPATAGPPIYEPKVLEQLGDVITGPHGQIARDALGEENTKGTVLDAGRCVPESAYEVHPSKSGTMEGMYGTDTCRRLRVVFGPIWTKPGQDDVLIQPVTIEKPLYDGYLVRFKPNMVDALGQTPPVEQLHLHHGTWLNVAPSYGSGPWFATGEEKTIGTWPYRYGLRVGQRDSWLFLHMVHNATAQTFPVWVTYDLDFIPAAKGSAIQPDGRPLITNTKGIWLDVGGGKFHDKTENYFLNPIFNVQKGYGSGGTDALGRPTGICRWPDQNCAGFNSNGNLSAQQGVNVSDEVAGKDFKIPDGFLGPTKKGTLVVMGGHVHNGGLRTEVELVRDGVSRPINISEAYYWMDDPVQDRIGAPPISWDYSQTGSTLDYGWAVNVQEGDILRLNGVYETDIASWYEQMGIVMTWVVPGGAPEGIDVFAPETTINAGIPSEAVTPKGPDGVPLVADCVANNAGQAGPDQLCLRGQLTHGQVPSSGNHGFTQSSFDWRTVSDGLHLNEVPIGGFSYGLTEQGVAGFAGVPYVNLGEKIAFHNADTADYMWHTVTRCAAPCDGPTTVDYPIANGGSGPNDVMDFDSTQLGVGTGPTQRTSWAFTPTETGTFTFFCRVHPSMRGVFRVK